MIKGVRVGGVGRTLSYLDTLEMPIIENTPNEEDLKDSMADAMKRYPEAAGVLVRRHGVYVWGPYCPIYIFPLVPLTIRRSRLGKSKDPGRGLSFCLASRLSLKFYLQCLDYLFEIGVKMKLAGLPTVVSALAEKRNNKKKL
jgi:methylthioribulose-1-phosphate dehydratase